MADVISEDRPITPADYAALVESHFDDADSDGIVVMPVTEKRLAEAIASSGRNGDDVLGAFPSGKNVTVRDLSDVAMIAGCRPSSMPVLVAALEAMLTPNFPLSLLLQSEGGYFLYLIVNGPIRHEIELNCRANVFGPGFRVNSTIGRALNLVLTRFGGADPRRSTLGNAYKFSCVIGEDEERSPWLPLSVSLGWEEDDSVVTVMVGVQTKVLSHQLSRRPEHLLSTFAEEISTASQFNPFDIPTPKGLARKAVLVLADDHRGFMRDAGWGRERIQEYLHSVTRRSAGDIRASGYKTDSRLSQAGNDQWIDVYGSPEDFLVVSAGSGGGRTMVGAVAGIATRRIEKSKARLAPIEVIDRPPQTLDDFVSAVGQYMDRQVTDGWPVIPPDAQLVAQLVAATSRDPDDPLGVAPWRSGPITVQDMAINAVMAGCRVEYMPLLCSLYELLFHPTNGVTTGLAASTMGYNAWYIVHGPIARELGINSGSGLLGPGSRVNVALGRAIRLGMINLASLKPDLVDRSCLGQAFKYGAVIAEDENGPWGPLHTCFGFRADESVVTMSWGAHPRITFNSEANEPEQLLKSITEDIALIAYFDSPVARGPAEGGPGTTLEDPGNFIRQRERLLVMSEGHRKILEVAGWSRRQTQEYLFEHSKRLVADANAKGFATSPFIQPGSPDDLRVPLVPHPDSFHVLFAGGAGDVTVANSSIITSRRVSDRGPDAIFARLSTN